MKFGDIKKQVNQGDLKSLNSDILKAIGQRYLEKFGENPGMLHKYQPVAKSLIDFATKNQDASNVECANKLIESLCHVNTGWMLNKITELLNKVLNTNIQTCYIAGKTVVNKLPNNIAIEFKGELNKQTKVDPIMFNQRSYPENATFLDTTFDHLL
ncbi:MAG: hypothetical protein EP298_04305 [Gammaproteobacteria bacterium]|nr:MAG: hypothetical protein EP298_04305 [Gammaproteobacteria bacterium]UTW43852.1 hypothetical protein KFE69_07115 [bacterium SCSIO 12844]